MQAFRFSLQHNDTYALREYPPLTENQRIHQEILPDMSGKARSGVHRCEACGDLLTKWDEPLTGVIVKKRKHDIGSTYDGVTLVSERFKAACESSNLSGLVFRQLPDDPAFYAILALRSVEFDAERRKTRFINPCQSAVALNPWSGPRRSISRLDRKSDFKNLYARIWNSAVMMRNTPCCCAVHMRLML
jgi:hypothetical protein